MYATIKGTLTENDGVFSGFSASNYLQLQNAFDITSNFEICFKINSWQSTGDTQYFLSLRGNKNLNLYFSSNGRVIACYYGSYWYDLANNLTVGEPITIKVSGNGTDITITIIQGSYSKTNSKLISEIGLSGNFIIHFGKGGATLPFISGSIDLNNSYIKLGSTKYKLQAVVGYTVVGSPTITDGVVSGFSASDYLQTQKNLNITKNQDFEFCTVFSIQTLTSNFSYLMQTSDTYSLYIDFTSSRLRFRFANEDNTTQVNNIYFDLATDTKYKVTWKYTALTNTHIFTLEQNNNILGQTQGIYAPKTINLPILYGRSNINLKNIYMNETYIKLNDKLWFNGQPA